MSAHPLSRGALREPLPVDLAEVKARAARIVSDRTGIVSSVQLVETGPCDPTVYWARASVSDSTTVLGARARNEGNACAVEIDRAVVKALGEAIERYCAASVDADALTLARFRDLGQSAVRPEAWGLFAEAQFEDPEFLAARFDDDTQVCWTTGFSLTHDRPVLVPASLTFIPYLPVTGEARILPWQTSTGLASHTSLTRAALKGLLEVIERDAFMLFWHRRIRCPEIDVSEIGDHALRDLLARTETWGFERSIRLLTLDVPIPVVLVVLRSEAQKPYVVMGCAADPAPEVALRLALEEALLSLHGVAAVSDRDSVYRPETPGYDDVRDLFRHAWVYAVDPALKPVMADQLMPSGRVDFDQLPGAPSGSTLEQLRWLVDRLRARDLEAIVVDLTTPDIDDVGFKVARAHIPGTRPLDVDHRFRHLGGRRLSCAAETLGVAPVRMAGGLNAFPHPFP